MIGTSMGSVMVHFVSRVCVYCLRVCAFIVYANISLLIRGCAVRGATSVKGGGSVVLFPE